MSEIKGKRAISYAILAFLSVLFCIALIPAGSAFGIGETQSIRITRSEQNITVDNGAETSNALSFSECEIFGIRKLINNFYDAYLGEDEQLMRYIDTLGAMDLDQRNFAKEHIEKYMDIRCYCMEGNMDGSYLVVTYAYAKHYGIDTTIPTVGHFFVRMNANGTYYICNSIISDESSSYNELMFESRQVMELYEMAQYELDTACEVDDNLKDYVETYREFFDYNK
ncbi:MAG: hypothetical protein ACI4GD_10400 [Lachnospiraceae bacterium]